MSKEEVIKEGALSKDFTLEDQKGYKFTLSDLKGMKVLLSFHPLAGTSVCAEQMKSLEENREKFEELNTVPVGISVDSVPAKKLWAEDIGVEETRLLSDFWPHGKVIKMYGLFREEDGFSERANILIDEDQKVIFSKVYPIGEVPDLDEIFTKIEER